MTWYKADFKEDEVPLKYEILHIMNQKTIVGEDIKEPDRYQAGHIYYYPS